MKILILAAGYGTRLYPLTLDTPKPLLKIGSKTVVDFLIEKLANVEGISEIFIVTNQKFYANFADWLKKLKSQFKIEIINDRTKTNEDRIGAIGDIQLVIKDKKIDEDLLVIGGDNLFKEQLTDFVNFAKRKLPFSSIVLRDVGDKDSAKKYGIVEIDKENRILDFQEKPQEPKSTLAAGCIYVFSKKNLKLFDAYIKEGAQSKDAPGNFIAWLSKREPVYGYIFKKEWFDIGDIASLELAGKTFG